MVNAAADAGRRRLALAETAALAVALASFPAAGDCRGGDGGSSIDVQYGPAWADPDDAPDLWTPEWATKVAVTPVRRGRPQAAKRKLSTTIRTAFREQGEGWQTRLNAALCDWLDHH